MAQTKENPHWHIYVAFTTGLIAVLAAIASFQASGFSSQMLEEKNNAILFQSKANKQWNNYLANDIEKRVLLSNYPTPNKKIQNTLDEQTKEQIGFQKQASDLENQATSANNKFQTFFVKNSHMVTAGTFLEIAIALSSMSILVKRKSAWYLSLLLAGVGVYFLALGFI